MMSRSWHRAAGLVCATAAFGAAGLRAQAPAPTSSPTLVVLVAIDQFRGDYLDRFKGEWTGGFKRLLASGAHFVNGRQDHSSTATAPGHSTMLSGRWPVHTGVITNDAGVPDPAAPLLEVKAKTGASPRRFVGTTLVDWLVARDTATRVVSVSRKDRGAILPVGRLRGDVFWFAQDRFTTSTWYTDSLPEYVRLFNARAPFTSFAGQTWALSRPASAYSEADDVVGEDTTYGRTFPHRYPAAVPFDPSRVRAWPWTDSLTLALALDGVRARKLGQRGAVDVLVTALSTTDGIGHDYGPDSREMHDHLLRLDAWLGQFLDALDREVGAGRWTLALTADHGVTPLPERTGAPARRLALEPWADSLGAAWGARWRIDLGLSWDGGLLWADTAALSARGVRVDSLATALARRVGAEAGVRRVLTPAQLRALGPRDPDAVLLRRLLTPGAGWLVAAMPVPGMVFSDDPLGTSHDQGTPNDQWVPVLFAGAGIAPGRHLAPASTTDIAPTLAAVLKLRPTERLDGRTLQPALRGP